MHKMVTERAAAAGPAPFHGWRVVAGTFVLAVFGWGMGFYGPPIYLHAVREARGWPLALVSAAVTVHFLVGAVAVASLPALHRRFGVAAVTKVGALALALGVCGWAAATAPWQLLPALFLSGAGWAATGAAAINAIVSPWFVRGRPAALAMAYNGASIGGVVFSPLWVAAIDALGFPAAAAVVGAVMALVVWALAALLFARTPQQLGMLPDGDARGPATVAVMGSPREPSMGPSTPDRAAAAPLWRDARFVTLAAAMALSLFGQIGLLAHLFSLLVPAFGAQLAGVAMGIATAAAIAGRTLVGALMPAGADRRLVAALSYAVQIVGTLALILAAGSSVPLLLTGVVLFGAGIGNATSLPPLIAQSEFAEGDVARVVARIIAISQGAYAFAPAAFGLIQDLAPPASAAHPGAAPSLFAAAALVLALGIAALIAGRRP
jgi:hypothetical protein